MVDGFGSNSGLTGKVGCALLVGGTSGVTCINVTGLNILSLASNIIVPLWIVNDLSFDWQILHSFPDSFYGLVLNDSLFNFLGNILDLGLNGIIVGNGSFDWYSLCSGHFFVLDDFSFVWNSLDSFDLIVFNVLFFEGDVLNAGLDGNFYGNGALDEVLT